MRNAVVISVLLLFGVFSFAQTYNRTAAAQQVTAPPMGSTVFPAPMISSPSPYGGLSLQYGYATTVGWGYPPVLVTPTASFTTFSTSPVGATNATSNLQVGASNSTLESVTLPAVITEVEVVAPGTVLPESYVVATAPEIAGGRRFDFGAASFDVITARSYGQGPSLAEVAHAAREQRRTQGVRTFTNSDVQHLPNRQPGSSLDKSNRPALQNPSLPQDANPQPRQ